ncbi:M15 family metallopeptidase [Solitalea lacus]|uniref:M15 family metallopeptidase n=1 Tax=Solitalea lacus TaxID=2911172 RepID=UPI001EDBE597|nr:M15 family metallopeptidase [Solitalea lacus]UKJ08518.1 M15 family metallopeptidase [Solitalea lacus]
MKVILIGSQGQDVINWQYFLIGQQLYEGLVTGKFDLATKSATIMFQRLNGLQPDGIVGNKTVGTAMLLGFGTVTDNRETKTGEAWPAKPGFNPVITNEEREKLFGKFNYVSAPLPKDPENIKITDDWVVKNIETVDIPQLKSIRGSSKIQFHKKATPQLKKLWQDWEKANLLHNVLTWEGSYVPRFVRGSLTTLSNHSFGSAFDINYAWNKLGAVPALVGQKGCVRELVQIANENGFYWGGHFSRQDGMHFEIAVLK